MRTYSVMQARSRLTALLDDVASGEEIAITRRGQVIARLVPARQRMAADAFRPFWSGAEIDLDVPQDMPADSTSDIGRDQLSPEDARRLLAGSVLRYADPHGPVVDDDRDGRK